MDIWGGGTLQILHSLKNFGNYKSISRYENLDHNIDHNIYYINVVAIHFIY